MAAAWTSRQRRRWRPTAAAVKRIGSRRKVAQQVFAEMGGAAVVRNTNGETMQRGRHNACGHWDFQFSKADDLNLKFFPLPKRHCLSSGANKYFCRHEIRAPKSDDDILLTAQLNTGCTVKNKEASKVLTLLCK